MKQTGNRKTRAILVVLLALTLCAGSWHISYDAARLSSYAVTEEEKAAAQKDADTAKAAADAKRAEAKEAAKKAADATKSFDDAEKRLEELQGQMEQTKASISATEADIAATENEIAATKVRMKEKEAEIKEQNDALNNRLTAMYKTGTVGFVDVVLSSESVEDLLSNVGMVHKILESDQELLKKLQKDYAELEEMKTHLEEQEAVLVQKQAALEQKQIDLEGEEAETEELKKKYQAEADKYKAMEDQLEAEGQQLAAEAAAKQAAAEAMIVEQGGTVEATPGAYAWPTKSNWQITSNYGWRICPFHGREFHNGVDIVLTSGTNGSPVYAIADGVVTRASRYGGYGNCIQVAHGGGYSSLYGHLSGYNCSNGQYVTKGQVIGYIGSTGNSTGPHLHFTVFKDGSITNPLGLY